MSKDYLTDAFIQIRQRLRLVSGRVIVDSAEAEDVLQNTSNADEKKRIGDFEIDTMIGKNHKENAKGLDAEFFFAHPHHSWDRGANENTSGPIRKYIPQGTDFCELTDD